MMLQLLCRQEGGWAKPPPSPPVRRPLNQERRTAAITSRTFFCSILHSLWWQVQFQSMYRQLMGWQERERESSAHCSEVWQVWQQWQVWNFHSSPHRLIGVYWHILSLLSSYEGFMTGPSRWNAVWDHSLQICSVHSRKQVIGSK